MNALLSGRHFQLWDYSVSHGSLLIRSPKNEAAGFSSNIDIMFWGVEYIDLPRFFPEHIEFVVADKSDVEFIEERVRAVVRPANVFVFSGNGRRFRVLAAGGSRIAESVMDIHDSPFDINPHGE